MIRELTDIRDITVIEQNDFNNIDSVLSLKFKDEKVASGGFGSVYEIHSLDGYQKDNLLVKIYHDEDASQHAYDVVELLHRKLIQEQLRSGTPTFHQFPELLGIPFIGFRGTDSITGDDITGFLMYNLNTIDFIDYGSDKTPSVNDLNISIEDRLNLTYRLAKSVEFLHDINFVHSDLNPQSIFIAPKHCRLAIIDFDSGYHFDEQSKPSTIGKISHWIGSRFSNILSGQENSEELTTEQRISEEKWILANAIFELFFGVMPFFFLADASDSTKKRYLKENIWPEIDPSFDYFNSSNTSQYKQFKELYDHLKSVGFIELLRTFEKVFNKGFKNENKRVTPKAWTLILKSLNEEIKAIPAELEFRTNKSAISKKGEEVVVHWEGHKFNSVTINKKFVDLSKNSQIIILNDAETIEIEFKNEFGTLTNEISISANKTDPVIKQFSASSLLRESTEPVKLQWNTENTRTVNIVNSEMNLDSAGEINVDPRNDTTYTIQAIGNFDEIVEQTVTVNVIKPVINHFSWEINLNEGIDNVDISWNTTNANEVQISPIIGKRESYGIEHVPLKNETEFTIIAKGLFVSVSKTLKAAPFPVPVVKQLLVPMPKFDINTAIGEMDLSIPQNLIESLEFNLNQNISSVDFTPETEIIKNEIDYSNMQLSNKLESAYLKERKGLSYLYDKIKTIMNYNNSEKNERN